MLSLLVGHRPSEATPPCRLSLLEARFLSTCSAAAMSFGEVQGMCWYGWPGRTISSMDGQPAAVLDRDRAYHKVARASTTHCQQG